LTGGGSGGHIIPLLSLARELKVQSPSCNIVYIGHKGDKFDSQQLSYHDFDFVAFVNGGKFRRYHDSSVIAQMFDFKTLFFNIRDFFRVIGSIGKAWRILSRVRPDVIFSKGSFVAVPVGIAAHLKRIPIVTHDSDAVPGLANRIVGRWAKIHATGMPAEFYAYPKDKTIYTGIPIDGRIMSVNKDEQRKIKQSIGVDPDNLVLLVAGGGLGSKNVNNKIIQIAPELLTTNPKLHIIHQTGQSNEREAKEQYNNVVNSTISNRLSVFGFTGELYKYVMAADLVVSRAGASAIAEFAAAHKACLLIPSPFLTGGHQMKNAQELKKLGVVEVAHEEISPEELLGKIVKLLGDEKTRHELGAKLGATAKTNAANDLAKILLKIAG
jgi:UDP-N-acetylglucosamine--N-acetylmuramyl-(pentapeptide) pyrophosphoryl-undecaprenol N-acetylglucosamine transferase